MIDQATYRTNLYSFMAKCQATTRKGEPCKGLAVKGSLYCKHHTKGYTKHQPSLKTKRYALDSTFQANVYDKNLNDKDIFDLRNEIALLQTHLQTMLSNHSILSKSLAILPPIDQVKTIGLIDKNLNSQLFIIDRLEKLIKLTKSVEAQDKERLAYDMKVKLVLNKVVFVIDKLVTDIDTKRQIAQELYTLHTKGEDIIDTTANNGSKDIVLDKDNLIENTTITKEIVIDKEDKLKSKEMDDGRTEVKDRVLVQASSLPNPLPVHNSVDNSSVLEEK